MSESKSMAATRRAYAQRKSKEQETKTKAAKQAIATSYIPSQSGIINPLDVARRDAATGTTAKDKVNIAKQSGAVKSSYKASAKESKEKEEEKTNSLKEQTLSKYDKSKLTEGNQRLIAQAKIEYDRAKAAGDKPGMAKAHQEAEAVRQKAGYSGGAAGDQYLAPKLSTKEKTSLNAAGEQALQAAKMDYADARQANNLEKARAAWSRMQEIPSLRGFQPQEGKTLTSGTGRTVNVGAAATPEQFAKQLDAGMKAATAGAMGSILALGETAVQSTNNAVRANNREQIDSLANDLDLWRARLKLVQEGEGDPSWGSEAYIQNRIKIAENAQAMRSAGTTIDPTLPGQSALAMSRAWQQEATEGMTGAGKFLADTAISGLQMLPGIAASFVPVAGPALGTGILGAQAAGQKAYDVTQQGGTPEEALTRGVTSGVVEGATERMGIGNLLRIVRGAGGASFLKNIAHQMGIEATEESASYVLNYAADVAYQDPNAQFSLAELAESAAAGALLGGVFGGAGTAINSAVNRPAQTLQTSPEEQLLRAAGLRSAETENAPERPQEAQEGQTLQTQAETLRQANQELQARLEASRQQLEQIRRGVADVGTNEEGETVPIKTGTLSGDPSDTISSSEISLPSETENVNNELPEGQGAMSRGGAGEFATWQSETPGSQFHPINEQAAAVTAEERGRAPVEVPTVNLEGRLTSKTVSTLMNSNIMPNEMVEAVEADLAAGAYSRLAYTDPQALKKANAIIGEKGYQKAKEQWLMEAGSGKVSKDMTTLGVALIHHAANSPSLHVDAMDLLSIFQSNVRDGAQALQAVSMINKLTPEGQLYTLVKTVERMEENANQRQRGKRPNRIQRDALAAAEKAREDTLAKFLEPNSGLLDENDLYYGLENAGNNRRIDLDTKRAMREIGTNIQEIIREGAATKQETANKIAEMLTTRYDILPDYAQEFSEMVVSRFNARVAEEANKALETTFKKRKPREQKSAEQRFRELANLGAFSSSRFNALATEKLTGYSDVTIDPQLVDEFLAAETQKDRNAVKKKIYKDVASQLPNTFRDRFDAWRYSAMLGNIRSNVKNFGGNFGFAPVRISKNITGAAIESVFRPEERTKAFYNPVSAEGRAKIVAATKDFREVQDIVMATGKFRDDFSEIERERDVFASPNKVVNALLKPVSLYSKATSAALEAGDLLFAAPAYIDSLVGYLFANKITANQYAAMAEDDPMKIKAREYAVQEARKATYRDTNMFSDAISSISRTRHSKNPFVRNVVNPLVEGTLPFKRTPANIAVRGVEYSPIGLGIGAVDAARNVWWNAKEKRAEKLGQELTEAQREVKEGLKTPAEAIDEISAGLTGTGLLALGIFLAYQGFVTGGSSGDEKQDEFNELQGHQNYSMEVGDTSYTLDWLAPEALPFFVGVETYNNLVRLGAGDATIWDVISSVKNLAEPMLEMSMLQSLNDLFDTLGSDDPLISAAAQTATSYLTQAFPTLAGQVERSGEENRESTFVDRNSSVPPGVQRLLANLGNKIPGWEYNQADYVDAWGRKDSSGDVMDRVLENVVKPWYQSDIKSSNTERELQRLYDAGYEGVFPGTFQKNAEINGEYVTADQYTAMQTTRGQTAKRILDSFISTDLYADMSDDEKAKFIEKVYDYAAEKGKAAGGADLEDFDSWVTAASDAESAVGMSEADFISLYAYKSILNEEAGDEIDNNFKQGMFEDYIDATDRLTDEQKKYVKENVLFWNFVPADSGQYHRAVAAGYSDPKEIQSLFESRKDYDMDGDGNTSSNAEIYNYISSATEDAQEREKMWKALQSKGETRSFSEFEKDTAATTKAIKNAKASLDEAVSSEKQTAFAAAISNAGADSQAEIKAALLSVDATDAERAAYYNLTKAKRGWKKTYYQVKMK